MDRSPADHLELEVGTVRIPFELLTLLTHLASEDFHGDREPEVVSDSLALLYPQLNRIEDEAILARGMDPWGWADFGVELVEEIRGRHLVRAQWQPATEGGGGANSKVTSEALSSQDSLH